MSEPVIPKLGWAHEQLQRLQTDCNEWLGGEHHTIVSEPDDSLDPHRLANTAFYIEAEPLPDRFSPMVGDVLQAMRSGLDHLAYALAAHHTTPLPDDWAELSEFPIFGDESKSGTPRTGCNRFHQASRRGLPIPSSGLAKIQGIAPQAQAFIETLQPYHRGTAFRDDPLWRLHELSRIDKHRLVHVVTADFDGVGILPNKSRNWWMAEGLIYSYKGPVEGPILEHPEATQCLRRHPARGVRGRLPSTPTGAHRGSLKSNQPSLHETQGGSAPTWRRSVRRTTRRKAPLWLGR
jgi:hypothetical protein